MPLPAVRPEWEGYYLKRVPSASHAMPVAGRLNPPGWGGAIDAAWLVPEPAPVAAFAFKSRQSPHRV